MSDTQRLCAGFWASNEDPSLPDPRDHVDASWDPEERHLVTAYLARMPKLTAYRGWSTCRFCGKPNGSAEHDDGVYRWPEGLPHYLEAHGVKPEPAFLTHVFKRVMP